MGRRLIGGIALAGAAAVAALLVSYGGHDQDEPAFEDLSAQRVAELAVDRMLALESVRIEGTFGVELAHISLQVAVDGTCEGTISLEGGRAVFLRVRHEPLLVKGNATFLRWAWEEDEVTEEIREYSERWIRSGGMAIADDAWDLCELTDVLEYAGANASGKCTKGSHAEVAGQATFALECPGQKRLYVATRAPHHVLRVTRSDSDPRDLRFKDYDKPFDVDVPPESEVIDVTESV